MNRRGHYKVLSFDLDNALYDNKPVLAKAEKAIRSFLTAQSEAQGILLDFSEYQEIKSRLVATGDPSFENLSRLRISILRQLCRNLDNCEAIVEQAFEKFLIERSRIAVEPEILDMLHQLKCDYHLVSVSNGNCGLEQTPLASFFELNLSASDDYRAKPHPQMLEIVKSHFQVEASEILHLGDSWKKDGEAAKNAGVEFYHFAPFESGAFESDTCTRLLEWLARKPHLKGTGELSEGRNI